MIDEIVSIITGIVLIWLIFYLFDKYDQIFAKKKKEETIDSKLH